MERNRFKRLFSHASHRLGVEFGAVLIPVVDATYKGMPEEQVSHGISITRIAQQVGGAFGTAVLAANLQSQLIHGPMLDVASRANAFNYTFWWTIGFTACAIIPGVFLPGNRRKSWSFFEEKD
ncbi:hypothetical protein MUB24_20190 [Lederbergia sp. NSJ-179]|uniref:hypothetical protein n=1 Tax=Lederbergia sp. NSJ-179 TaxID=2931402 RepID=UPI001FD4D45C|nr:hypothetical protein [Lederbergia sp. NSJ-179]MCJ7843153.1 hypothetical protein [Lederbergia sp. NSJ-179]